MDFDFEDEKEVSGTINIVPLIDVLFALLTFFVMSTLFLTRSQGLPVNLPKASTGVSDKKAQVTVTIQSQGEISLNKQPIEIGALEDALRQKVQNNQELLVVINADEAANYGQVVTIMDKIRKVPGAKLAVATQK